MNLITQLLLFLREKIMPSTLPFIINTVATDAAGNVVVTTVDQPSLTVILNPKVTARYMPQSGDELIQFTQDEGTFLYTVAPLALPAAVESPVPPAPLSATWDTLATALNLANGIYAHIVTASGVSIAINTAATDMVSLPFSDLTSPITLTV